MKTVNHGRSFQPFKQGCLDGLCGGYSIINMVHVLYGPLTAEKALDHFVGVMGSLDKEDVGRCTLSRVEEGMTTHDISKGLRYISLKYPVSCKRPFFMKRCVTLAEFWTYIQEFTNEKKGAVILSIEKEDDYSHWTTVHRASEKTLFLFDSDGGSRVYRKNCTVSDRYAGKKIFIDVRSAFFVSHR